MAKKTQKALDEALEFKRTLMQLEKRRNELNLEIENLMQQRVRCDTELKHVMDKLENLKMEIEMAKEG